MWGLLSVSTWCCSSDSVGVYSSETSGEGEREGGSEWMEVVVSVYMAWWEEIYSHFKLFFVT